MPVEQLKAYLDREKIRYVSITHSPAFTAQEIAASAHIPGRELAKTVMVKLDGKLAMAVLPASLRVDFDQLRQATGAKKVELADEKEFLTRFPDCAPGAMPPFGNLYGFDVYVTDALAEDEEIAFNAGSFTELIRLAYRDFARLVQPKVMRFAATV